MTSTVEFKCRHKKLSTRPEEKFLFATKALESTFLQNHHLEKRKRLYSPTEHFRKETCHAIIVKQLFSCFCFLPKIQILQNFFSQHRNLQGSKRCATGFLLSSFLPFSPFILRLFPPASSVLLYLLIKRPSSKPY